MTARHRENAPPSASVHRLPRARWVKPPDVEAEHDDPIRGSMVVEPEVAAAVAALD
ncbi:hypothetical protein ACJ4V0_15935 [Phreatobacter sp. HK31-P]